MARHVIGFRLTASQAARPVDDFDLQFLTLRSRPSPGDGAGPRLPSAGISSLWSWSPQNRRQLHFRVRAAQPEPGHATAIRPFLPQTELWVTSRTPSNARICSSPAAKSSGHWSSTSNVMTANCRRPIGPVAVTGAPAVTSSNANARRQLLMPGRVRAPNPMPLRESWQTRPPSGAPALMRWRARAAPVGVTRSPGMPSSTTGRPCRRSAAAGAGMGRTPCAVLIRPDPIGNGADVQRSARISEINCAAATISTIESIAPTS